MEFELLHDATAEVLRPLRAFARRFVVENPFAALLALALVPTGLLWLSRQLENDLNRARARARAKKAS